MGVVSTMSTAISGLEANGEMLSVISDNIVNANTTAFKGSRAEFNAILMEDKLNSAGGNQLGSGARVAAITSLFTQGSISRTNRATDMAINGQGFFVLKSDRGTTFTRDGAFRFDKDGWMTTFGGAKVQAYQASPEGKVTGKMGDIRLSYTAIPAKPTNKVSLHCNLDARLPVGGPLNLERPEDTAHYTTATQIFDSVGNSHPVSMYFNRTAENTWEWYAMTDGGDVQGGIKGTPSTVARGSLEFDQVGKLNAVTQEQVNTTFMGGAVPDQALVFDFGDSLAEQGTGQKGTTMYGATNGVFRNVQDGFTAGHLADTIVDGDGMITGVYSNGENRVLGQMAIARFEAPERLTKTGENMFLETPGSGQAEVGKAKTNGRGAIATRALEASNIDLASEFVEMIKAQRGFQASAKSISTANDMLEEIINLKRG
jgi:flagellar hook protein FlgE